ncbi:haloacid dehalogenase type II [soil metagenome]|nr:haloacid dehalogenase type II [Deinococcota bacterium]
MTHDLASVKALTFDVFGTVVDWRTSIIGECEELAAATGQAMDCARFADAWRDGYRPAMDRVQRGELPWTTIDRLHRTILDELLREFELTGLSEAQKDHLNRAWHRLTPWPDSVAGLRRLRQRFITATLSNGNVALLVNMAKHSDLAWDCILSAELARRYKPDPATYQMATDLLGLEPSEVMMVAAHQSDLRAAQACGLKAAFIPRPLEFGPERVPDLSPDPAFDIVARDLGELATKLGV